MASTIFRLKVVQWALYVHLHMPPLIPGENFKSIIYTLIFETFQELAVDLHTIFPSYGTESE